MQGLHLAVHTWPEIASVTPDVYGCNYGGDNSAKARGLFDALRKTFEATEVQSNILQRGAPPISVTGATAPLRAAAS